MAFKLTMRKTLAISCSSINDNPDRTIRDGDTDEQVEVGDIQISTAVWVELDCSDAGDGEVSAEVIGSNAGNVPVAVKDMGTDKYRVSFEPTDVDVYNLSIFYGTNHNQFAVYGTRTDHVTGSPFSINLYHPDRPNSEKVDQAQDDGQSSDGKWWNSSCSESSLSEEANDTGTADNSETGQDVAQTIETKEAGRGNLSVKAEGKVSGTVPIKITPNDDGTFVVFFNTKLFPDIYTIDVSWDKGR